MCVRWRFFVLLGYNGIVEVPLLERRRLKTKRLAVVLETLDFLGRVFEFCIGRESKVEGLMVRIHDSSNKMVIYPSVHDSGGPQDYSR